MIPAVTLPTVISSSELLRVTLPVLPYSPVTALDVAPAKPIWRTWIATPSAGAEVNDSVLSETLYALDVEAVVGYWTTPSRVTRISLLLAGFLERVKAVVLPSPVKTSRVLSCVSKFVIVSARIWPNRTSVDTGAWLNTIVESESRPKPKVGEEDSCACWRTPLIAVSYTHLTLPTTERV